MELQNNLNLFTKKVKQNTAGQYLYENVSFYIFNVLKIVSYSFTVEFLSLKFYCISTFKSHFIWSFFFFFLMIQYSTAFEVKKHES